MKEFMLVFLGADYSQLNLSPQQMQERMSKWWAWNTKMEQAGILKGGHALTPGVRRISGNERTVTDLTATEVKELIGGYYVVDAENLEAASQIAQDFPDFDLGGTVEIREVMVFEQ